MKRILIPLALLSTLAIGAAGCGGDGNPVAPSETISQSDSAATTSDARTEIALTGLVRNLNWRAHTFTLVGRTDSSSHLIHLNDRTEIMAGDRRVRPRSLENGVAVEVHGVADGNDVLAVKIVIVRHSGR